MNSREKEQLKVDFEKQILESKLEIQEQTFRHISQEIHDNIGQVLSLAKLTLNNLYASPPEVLKEKIDSSRDLIGKAIVDLRNLSKSLNTDYIKEMGLLRSVEYELEMLGKASSFDIELNTDGTMYRLEHRQELIIFRIFQEVLQNIIKHSNASRIQVLFCYQPESFHLEIADDGKGFDVSRLNGNVKDSSGMGLRNIDYRAKMIAADFSVTSDPVAGGTTVKIKFAITTIN
jgi:two-component system, NarL family, sensor kinase